MSDSTTPKAYDHADARVGNSRMTDTLDFAAELQDEENKAAVERARQHLAPQAHPGFDGKHCIDCGDDMPALRLANKRIRCTICQGKQERRDAGR